MKRGEFKVDSGASVHLMSKCDLSAEEQDIIRKSKELCEVMTANGSSTTTEEASVCVRDLDMFINVQLLEYSPVVLSSGKMVKKIGVPVNGW